MRSLLLHPLEAKPRSDLTIFGPKRKSSCFYEVIKVIGSATSPKRSSQLHRPFSPYALRSSLCFEVMGMLTWTLRRVNCHLVGWFVNWTGWWECSRWRVLLPVMKTAYSSADFIANFWTKQWECSQWMALLPVLQVTCWRADLMTNVERWECSKWRRTL